jgi:hypothetical protein
MTVDLDPIFATNQSFVNKSPCLTVMDQVHGKVATEKREGQPFPTHGLVSVNTIDRVKQEVVREIWIELTLKADQVANGASDKGGR